MRTLTTTALACALTLPGVAAAQTQVDKGDIIPMAGWTYENIYAGGGWSVDRLIGTRVRSAGGEDLGEVEDVIFGPDARVISIIAEIGGVWDLGDHHVGVPWGEVTVDHAEDVVTVPITEDTVSDYDAFEVSGLPGSRLGDAIQSGLDDAAIEGRAWRATELVGDYARLRGADGVPLDYGYVSDMLIRDGRIAATVVDVSGGFGTGNYAYPHYGYYKYGWAPGDQYYDLPYGPGEVHEIDPFNYDQMRDGSS